MKKLTKQPSLSNLNEKAESEITEQFSAHIWPPPPNNAAPDLPDQREEGNE